MFFWGVVSVFFSCISAANTLDGLKNHTDTGEGTSNTHPQYTAADCSDAATTCTEHRNPSTAALIFGFFFHLPHYLIEKSSDYRHEDRFLSYPYEGGAKGYMAPPLYKMRRIQPPTTDAGDLLIGAADDTVEPSYRTRPVALRLLADYSFDFGNIHKTSAFLLFETRWRWGFEAGYSYLRERVDGGDGKTNGMGIGDANIVFRFAQHRLIQMRTGFGGRFMTAPWSEAKGGVNFTYGLDIYPFSPVVLSSSVDFGNLRYAFVFHGRGSVGAVFRSFELYVGWDVLQVDDTVVHGPLAGIRAWI